MALKLKHSDHFYESRAIRELLTSCMSCQCHRRQAAKSESDSTGGAASPVAEAAGTPRSGGFMAASRTPAATGDVNSNERDPHQATSNISSSSSNNATNTNSPFAASRLLATNQSNNESNEAVRKLPCESVVINLTLF